MTPQSDGTFYTIPARNQWTLGELRTDGGNCFFGSATSPQPWQVTCGRAHLNLVCLIHFYCGYYCVFIPAHIASHSFFLFSSFNQLVSFFLFKTISNACLVSGGTNLSSRDERTNLGTTVTSRHVCEHTFSQIPTTCPTRGATIFFKTLCSTVKVQKMAVQLIFFFANRCLPLGIRFTMPKWRMQTVLGKKGKLLKN